MKRPLNVVIANRLSQNIRRPALRTFAFVLLCSLVVSSSTSWAEEGSAPWAEHGMGMHIKYYGSADNDSALAIIGIHGDFEYGSFSEFSALIMSEKSDIRYSGIDMSAYWNYPPAAISPYAGYGLQLGVTDEKIRPVISASIEFGIIANLGEHMELLLSARAIETTEHDPNNILYGGGLVWEF